MAENQKTYRKIIGNKRYEFKAPNNAAGKYMAEQKFAEIELGLQRQSQSGAYNAFLAGLSNEESARVQWLAQKRFPELENPISRYYIDKDGDIAYSDIGGKYGPQGKQYKEFGSSIETFGLEKDDIYGLVGPAFTFAAEVVGTGAGMAKGAVLGIPGGPPGVVGGAMAGGAGGAAAGTAGSQALRAGLSFALDGPESEVEQAKNDIIWSAAFGAIPLGIQAKTMGEGIKRGLPVSMHWMVNKFPGVKGKNILRDILEEGGKDVDKIIAAAEKRGVTLTRGEAQFGAGRASDLQAYLQKQATAQKFNKFYMNRAAQVEKMVADFSQELLENLPASLKQAGANLAESAQDFLDTPKEIANSVKKYLEEQKKLRMERAGVVYRQAYAADAAGSDDVAAMVNNILNGEAIPGQGLDGVPLPGINIMLQNPNLNPTMRNYLTRIRDALYDKSTGPSPKQIFRETNAANKRAGKPAITMEEATEIAFSNYKVMNTTQNVHDVIKNDLREMQETLAKGMSEKHPTLSVVVPQIKEALNNGLKAHNPLYADANKIYSPDMGIIDFTQLQIVKNLARAAEVGGPDAVGVIKQMFEGRAKPSEILELKQVIQMEDPKLWQSMKADWLTTQWDDIVLSTSNPLGTPNKLLSRLGLQGELGALKSGESLARRSKTYEALFEPDELANLIEVAEILQSVRILQTQTQSATVPWSKLSQQIFDEAQNAGYNVSMLQPLLGLPNKVKTPVRAVMGETGERMQRETAQVYEDVLADAILDPKKAEQLKGASADINQRVSFWGQALIRGTAAQLLKESDEARQEAIDLRQQVEQERIDEEKRLKLLQQRQADPNLGARIDSARPATLNLPMFEGETEGPALGLDFDPSMSPTILPRDDDRELAMRLRARRSGIGGLV